MSDERCEICRIWKREPKPYDWSEAEPMVWGHCRFNAPTDQGWPRTQATDWCGDFVDAASYEAEIRVFKEAYKAATVAGFEKLKREGK